MPAKEAKKEYERMFRAAIKSEDSYTLMNRLSAMAQQYEDRGDLEKAKILEEQEDVAHTLFPTRTRKSPNDPPLRPDQPSDPPLRPDQIEYYGKLLSEWEQERKAAEPLLTITTLDRLMFYAKKQALDRFDCAQLLNITLDELANEFDTANNTRDIVQEIQ